MMLDKAKFEADLQALCEKHDVAAIAAAFVVRTQKDAMSVGMSRMQAMPSNIIAQLASEMADRISVLVDVHRVHQQTLEK